MIFYVIYFLLKLKDKMASSFNIGAVNIGCDGNIDNSANLEIMRKKS